MSYWKKVDLFEDYFQFDQLQYPVYRRFLELLHPSSWRSFSPTNKKHYLDCFRCVGFLVGAMKGPCFGLYLDDVTGSLQFETAEEYRRLEQEHSKFWPYFIFHQLVVNFENHNVNMVDRGPIPVPRVYWRLSAWKVKKATDIDYVVKEALHRGVEEITFHFHAMELDEVMKLVNYTMRKIPGVSKYWFGIRTNTNSAAEQIRQLFKPPPTTREMTLMVRDGYIWYHQKEDI